MKIISWNVNGVRACHKKGQLLSLIKNEAPDVLCIQELKSQEVDLPPELQKISGYYSFFNSAKKKGYAGVAIYSKYQPLEIDKNLGCDRFDQEGRFIKLRFKRFSLLNLYMPHGGRDKENLDYKVLCYKTLFKYLSKTSERIVLAGDFNIAHEEIDLERPKSNQNNIMFTKEERMLIDSLIELGFVDTFRYFNSEGGNYTWWPWLANARERNLGWRIDYIFISKQILQFLKNALIMNNIYGSDHCPVEVKINI